MSHTVTLSIVIPVYNEEMNIGKLNTRVENVMNSMDLSWEVIYINDGSHDRSLEILKMLAATNSHIRFIDLSRNFGHQLAISAGIEHSRGEYTVIMDGDGQDPPELIPDLYAKAKEGFEVVLEFFCNEEFLCCSFCCHF
jgi:dolichol-phosphate mannosyltransferase